MQQEFRNTFSIYINLDNMHHEFRNNFSKYINLDNMHQEFRKTYSIYIARYKQHISKVHLFDKVLLNHVNTPS